MTGERIAAGFARRAEDLASAAQRVRSGSDPEAIHDVRVAARRLIASLRIWSDLFPARERLRALRELRRIRRRLGKTRELEVHVALLESRVRRHGDVTHAAAAVLLGRMEDRLERRHRRAANRLRPKRMKRVMALLREAAAPLQRRTHSDPSVLEGARRLERELEGQARAAVQAARERPDDASLHRARIAVKKWRYGLECMDEAAPGTARRPVAPLREIQAVLGNANDCAMLRDVLARSARRLVADQGLDALRPLIDTLEEERRRAVEEFRDLAAALLSPAEVARLPGTPAAGSTWPTEEKERMARWLAGGGPTR